MAMTHLSPRKCFLDILKRLYIYFLVGGFNLLVYFLRGDADFLLESFVYCCLYLLVYFLESFLDVLLLLRA